MNAWLWALAILAGLYLTFLLARTVGRAIHIADHREGTADPGCCENDPPTDDR